MEEDLGFRPPFTLGHENVGWVAQLGEGVAGFKEGDAVAVYGPWGCGRCHSCQLSMENYCDNSSIIRRTDRRCQSRSDSQMSGPTWLCAML